MSRDAAALDRVLALLLGLVLLAAGVLAVLWQLDVLPGAGEETTVGPVRDAATTDWWPWAVGGVGLVLVLLVLWWAAVHVRRGRAGSLRLAGSDGSGSLVLNPGAVVGAAGDTLARRSGVAGVRTSVSDERGSTVAQLVVTAEAGADLSRVLTDAEEICRDLAGALDGEPLAVRVLLHTTAAKKG